MSISVLWVKFFEICDLCLMILCSLLSNAFEELVAFQRALKDFVASIDATYAKQYEEFYIGLEGSFGSKHVSPRTLTSCFLSCVVCVEGIVTKCKWATVGDPWNGGGVDLGVWKAGEVE